MDDMITTSEAAALLGIGESAIVKRCKRGEIPGAYLPWGSRKLGYRLPRRVVEAILAAELTRRMPVSSAQ